MVKRYPRICLVVLGMIVSSLTNVAAGQLQSYDLVERVLNTSLLIEIETELLLTNIFASGLFFDVST